MNFGKILLERNAIGDWQLKENLAVSAMSMLREDVDYHDLTGTKCDFGYLYQIEGYGLEALFRVETDICTTYFAAQGDVLMQVEMPDEQFREATELFLKMHP